MYKVPVPTRCSAHRFLPAAHLQRGRWRWPHCCGDCPPLPAQGCLRSYRFYRSLEGSFSAGSTVTIATKYSFFQVFRDLQNYLAKFSKILQNFQKISDFRKNQHLFYKNPEIGKLRKNLQNLCFFFLQKFATFSKNQLLE